MIDKELTEGDLEGKEVFKSGDSEWESAKKEEIHFY